MSPALKTGTMAAFLKEGGIKPSEKVCLNKSHRIGANSAAQFMRIEAGMPSGPQHNYERAP